MSEPAPKRPRRSQAERRASTRARLLDATIECLAEHGFAKTTAQVVAERAGLTRGAQVHHFGNKNQLVAHALEHLLDRGSAQFRAALEAAPVDQDRVTVALEILWDIMTGTTGLAYMELVWAARGDPELNAALVAVNRANDERVDAMFREFFGTTAEAEEYFDLVWTAVFALIEGLAFEKRLRPDDPRVERVFLAVKQLAPQFVKARS